MATPVMRNDAVALVDRRHPRHLDHDGRADSSTVFFQSPLIDSPHGVCVLGNTALVSANGAIHRLVDTDGDDRADVHEKLFTGIGGAQHDHGAHQVMFGPDGRFYFNVGNDGGQIRDMTD